jgi:hypothetical protein
MSTAAGLPADALATVADGVSAERMAATVAIRRGAAVHGPTGWTVASLTAIVLSLIGDRR